MFRNQFDGATVLVTGHTGFKGSWLTTWLHYLGAKVTGFSIDVPTSPSMFEAAQLNTVIRDVRGDIRERDEVNRVVQETRPDFIFHLAAQPIVSTSYKEPVDTFATNVMGTVNVLEALRTIDWPCVAIMVTSDKCYDNVEWIWGYKETDALGGKDIYSGSKGAAELAIRSYFNSFLKSSPYVRLGVGRAGNVIGGGDWAKDRIVVDTMIAWDKGVTVDIRSPDATRPWQHVLEPLSGYLEFAAELRCNCTLNGEAFNFGPSAEKTRTVVDLLDTLNKYWQDLACDPYQVTDNIPFHEAGLLKLNCDKARVFLSWRANLEYDEMARMLVDWYKGYYQGKENMFDLTLLQVQHYSKLAESRGISWAS